MSGWESNGGSSPIVFTESFNQTDSTTLGPILTWAEITGNAQTVSNRVRVVTLNSSAYARADADVTTDDMYAEASLVTFPATGPGLTNRNAGVCARCDASGAVTFYHARLVHSTALGFVYQLFKFVSGAATQLGSNVPVTPSLPEVVRVECLGDQIRCVRDGVTIIGPITDTAIPTGTRGGLRLFELEAAGNTEMDDFEVGDLV